MLSLLNINPMWNANYSKDGALASVLASSLWLDEDLTYHPEPLEILAQIYHASAYQGQMGARRTMPCCGSG